MRFTVTSNTNPELNSKRMVFLPLALTIILLDQLGKWHVARTLEVGARVPLIGDLVALTHLPVAGGAFGFFRDWMPEAQLIGFALLSIVATFVIVVFYRGLARGEHGSAAALGAILGGIASNTVDRVRYGSGIDFLHLGSVEAEALPDFNLADIAIVLGDATLIVELFATEMVGRVADKAVQIHGGAGYISEYAVERLYRDVRLFRLYEGTTQIQQMIIARNMIRDIQ